MIYKRNDEMEFIKEYKKYQIYKVDSIEIDSSGSEGSSRLHGLIRLGLIDLASISFAVLLA